ncbi:ATP-binding protein [Varunaivibrio sulfuroxidans]|uniref:histidine kinase n=1 Tax=Varunaivibrio sulfuroxidans TaxID=1773489 RepID=A0A4V2UN66_9PROT|nr:ATP-binding protein [Varunaivibrio sulfuroxidans]TCS60891.1 signal transduction histidine kinase [Varunaivibrio sulfuroxidans]WES31700.1 ATP-binding protein [Varunaivibrio sulfuroxidans]
MPSVSALVKRVLPKSLLGRSLLILVTPLVLLQVVSALIFFETHWSKVTLKMARTVAADIAVVIDLMREFPDAHHQQWIFHRASDLNFRLKMMPGKILENTVPQGNNLGERMLILAMDEYVRKPFRFYPNMEARHMVIDVQLAHGVLRVIVSDKRLFSSTASVFVLWMVGTSLLLFGVATIFMRNQVRPIRRLARAADDFGKGRDSPKFKPEGASEVRQAASAFIVMRDRLVRQIAQRTEMLAGVSHDLRTPLTRMKLQLAMMGDVEGAGELKQDIDDMEHMLGEYLAFARGEGGEKPAEIELSEMLHDIVAKARRKGGRIDFHSEGMVVVTGRLNALTRCLTNLLDNAVRYGRTVAVRLGVRENSVEVVIDDDGPGIPKDKRADVFKPFFRLDGSRNPVTGGVGLGMTIARDVVRAQGGDIELTDAPLGGLRVKVRLPL